MGVMKRMLNPTQGLGGIGRLMNPSSAVLSGLNRFMRPSAGGLSPLLGAPGRIGKLAEVEWFFDRKRVIDAMDHATRRVLSIFGARVRRRARHSIRRPRRKRPDEMTKYERFLYHRSGGRDVPYMPSEPGKPPKNVTGLLRGFIFYWYDPFERSVAIGPAKLAGMKGDVPGVLEHGGPTRNRRGFSFSIEARPYMGPAFDKELAALDPLWRNSVRRAA